MNFSSKIILPVISLGILFTSNAMQHETIQKAAAAATSSEMPRSSNANLVKLVDAIDETVPLDKIQPLIEASPNLNAISQTGHVSPLEQAAKNNRADIIEALIKAGAAVNAISSFNFTALQMAVNFNSLDALNKLIELGANVNIVHPYLKYTPLIRAAFFGQLPIVKALVNAGADIKAREYFGNTAREEAERHLTADSRLSAEKINSIKEVIAFLKQHEESGAK